MNISEITSQNPFRIIGTHSGASAKEIQKNISKLKAYLKIGKSPTFDYDFNFLNFSEVVRNEEVISKLENRILLEMDKVKYALFWFVNSSTIDSIALNNLSQGNIDKAIEIWSKNVEGKSIGKYNLTAYNNLSSLLLYKSLDSTKTNQFFKGERATIDLRKAITYKFNLLNSVHFIDFLENVTKSKNADILLLKSFFQEKILEILSINYDFEDLINFSSGMSSDLKSVFQQHLVSEPIKVLKNNIEKANEELELNHAKGIEIGKKLIKESAQKITLLRDITGKDDFEYQSIANKLANQIMQCGVLCFNKTKEDYDYLSSYKYALSIAVDKKTIKRAEDCIQHCEDEKDSNICSCCLENKIDDNCKIEVTIYKETNRSYNKVNYKVLDLPIYICSECDNLIKEEQKKARKLGLIFALVGLLIGLSIGLENKHEILGAVIGSVVGFFVGVFFASSNHQDKAKNNNVILNKYLEDGWGFNEPTAN